MTEERNNILINIRPVLKNAKVLDNSTEIETFQNRTLRPIIKFQHSLLIAIIRTSIQNYKIDFLDKTELKISEYISDLLQKNKGISLQIIHSITGLFTTDEYIFYTKNSKEVHKRIIQMCKERFQTNLEEIKL